jgi:Cu/Zn superoxide dismutase
LSPSIPFMNHLRAHGTRALGLGAVVLGLAVLSAAPASASDRAVTLGAGLGPYVTPATGVVAGAGVTGTATVVSRRGVTEVEATVRGLQPGSRHAAHVHLGSCLSLLGHLRFDPNGPGVRANEVWLDLTANGAGKASAEVRVNAFDLNQPLSIVVHQNANPDVVAGSVPGARIACGNLVPPGQLDLRVGPYAMAAPAVVANAGVTGRARLATENGTTEVRLFATGLQPGSRHAAHVHLGSCAAQLGHLRYDPNGPASRANEVWLDLTANRDGRASATVRVRAIDLRQPLSVVIHQNANPDVVAGSVPGARLACGPVAAHS